MGSGHGTIIANSSGRTRSRQRHADAGGRRRLVAHRLAGCPPPCPSARPRSSRGHAAARPGRCAAAEYGRPRPGGVMPPAKSAAPGARHRASVPPARPAVLAQPPHQIRGGVGLRRKRRQAAVAALRHVLSPPPSPPLGGLQPPPPPSRGSGGWASCRAVGRPVRPPRSLAGRQCPQPSARPASMPDGRAAILAAAWSARRRPVGSRGPPPPSARPSPGCNSCYVDFIIKIICKLFHIKIPIAKMAVFSGFFVVFAKCARILGFHCHSVFWYNCGPGPVVRPGKKSGPAGVSSTHGAGSAGCVGAHEPWPV
jgi:hypothetical protein